MVEAPCCETKMNDKVLIGSIADFPEGDIRSATLPDGTVIAVYNVAGVIHATEDRCSHGEASLSDEGSLCGSIVECPWHFGSFDVVSGKATGLPCTIALRTYPVQLDGDRVLVQIETHMKVECDG